MKSFDRRRALFVMLGSTASALAAVSAWSLRPDSWRAFLRVLGETGDDPGLIAALGRGYVELHPSEASVSALVDQLRLKAVKSTRASALLSFEALTADRIAADYTAGEVVMIQGWMISKTEGRLMALAFLLS